jgi:hypothetical protein
MMVAAGAMTMPAMNGMSVGGGLGLSDELHAEVEGGQQSSGNSIWNWITGLFGYGTTQAPTPPPEPFDPPPAGGDQYAELEELQQQFTDADRAGIIDPNNTLRMAIVDNTNGDTFAEAMGRTHETLFVVFPIYAGGVLLEVSATLSGPEELAALRLLLAAKGLIIQTVKQGGKQVLRIIKDKAKKELVEVTEAEAKALINEAKRKAKQVAAKSAGELFEDRVKAIFRKKIIRENELLRDAAGKVIGEIDFEIPEALVEVGISLAGKMKQLHRLAEVAAQRGKKLLVIYGQDTAPGTLEALKKSLGKKWGNRVVFIPTM